MAKSRAGVTIGGRKAFEGERHEGLGGGGLITRPREGSGVPEEAIRVARCGREKRGGRGGGGGGRTTRTHMAKSWVGGAIEGDGCSRASMLGCKAGKCSSHAEP